MDTTKGDDDKGLNYVFLGDSGVIHVEKPTRWDEKPPQKSSEQVQAEIDHLLKVSDVFRERMEIRNSIRKWSDKIQWLADFLEYPYLPKMSAQEVYNEHQEMVERKVQRATFASGDAYPAESLLVLQEDGNLDKDAKTLKKEEFAKQVSYKFKWYIKHAGYERAADYVKWTLAAMEDESAKSEVIETVRLTVGKVLSDLIRQRQSEDAVKAFFKLGTVCRLEREDLFEVKEIELRNPAMQKAFLKALAGVIGLDPALLAYQEVRAHMSELGFFTEDEADNSPEAAAVVKETLKKALEETAIYFRENLNAIRRAGLEVAAETEMPRCKTVLIGRLVKKMRKSPRYFAAISERWENWGLIDTADLADNREIAMIFGDHLQRCYDKHPLYYNKMKYHWSGYGLFENRNAEKGHAMSANWAIKHEFDVQDEEVDNLLRDYEEETRKGERLVEQEDADENMSVVRFRLFCESKRQAFECECPQYASGFPAEM